MYELLKGYLGGLALILFGAVMVGLIYPVGAVWLGAPPAVVDSTKPLLYAYCALIILVFALTVMVVTYQERRFIWRQLLWRLRRQRLIDSEFQPPDVPSESQRPTP